MQIACGMFVSRVFLPPIWQYKRSGHLPRWGSLTERLSRCRLQLAGGLCFLLLRN